MFSLLRHHNFMLLWTASLVSSVGDWMLFVALPVFVFQATGSILATGFMAIIGTLPRLILGPIAGVCVDRWNRKRTLVAVELGQALVLLILLIQPLLFNLSNWIIFLYCAVLLQTSISVFFQPAQSAFVPTLVPDELLIKANALNGLSWHLTQFIGLGLGGLAVNILGLRLVLLIDSISFFVSGVIIQLITVSTSLMIGQQFAGRGKGTIDFENGAGFRLGEKKETHNKKEVIQQSFQFTAGVYTQYSKQHPKVFAQLGTSRYDQRPASVSRIVAATPDAASISSRPNANNALINIWFDLLEGVRLIRRNVFISIIFVVEGLAFCAEGIFIVLFVVWVRKILHGNGFTYSWLMMVLPVGGIVGSIAIGYLSAMLRPKFLLAVSGMLFGITLLVVFNVPNFAIDLIFRLLGGVPVIVFWVSVETILQQAVDDTYRGRVFGVSNTIGALMLLVGQMLGVAFGTLLGVIAMLNLAGSLYFLAGVGAIALFVVRSAKI